MNDYLAENGRIILIIGQLSINDSVQFLGVPNHSGGSGLPFICILKDLIEATGWGSGHTYNHKWGGSRFGPYSVNNVALGASVDP